MSKMSSQRWMSSAEANRGTFGVRPLLTRKVSWIWSREQIESVNDDRTR